MKMRREIFRSRVEGVFKRLILSTYYLMFPQSGKKIFTNYTNYVNEPVEKNIVFRINLFHKLHRAVSIRCVINNINRRLAVIRAIHG